MERIDPILDRLPPNQSLALLAERVTRANVAALEAALEPLHPLLRAAVRKGLRAHSPGGHLLNPVVTDGRRGVQCLFNVALFQNIAIVGGVAPDTGQAVGLQFQPYGEVILRAGVRPLRLAHFVVDTHDVLDVMSDLMGEYICLGKVAVRAEAILELIIESESPFLWEKTTG